LGVSIEDIMGLMSGDFSLPQMGDGHVFFIQGLVSGIDFGFGLPMCIAQFY